MKCSTRVERFKQAGLREGNKSVVAVTTDGDVSKTLQEGDKELENKAVRGFRFFLRLQLYDLAETATQSSVKQVTRKSVNPPCSLRVFQQTHSEASPVIHETRVCNHHVMRLCFIVCEHPHRNQRNSPGEPMRTMPSSGPRATIVRSPVL